MRIRLFMFCLFTVLTFIIPMFSVGTPLALPAESNPPKASSSISASSESVSQTAAAGNTQPVFLPSLEKKSFKVLDVATGKVNEIPVKDYIRGALAAEMPTSFHLEALKAQAVSAHSYALFCSLQQQKNPDPALKGADLSANSKTNQGYLTEEQAKEMWGDSFTINWTRICEAADSVQNLVMTYQGQPILAAYHSISSGKTEAADKVWQVSVPYLVPVESQGDILAPGYESVVTFTSKELKAKLTAAFPGIALSDKPEEWIKPLETSESGYHTLIAVGDRQVHGKEIRAALNLRSSDFDIVYSKDSFQFYVVGYGHGVGLSQYGADYMARQGASYQEILLHYYPGAEISQVSES